MSALSRSFWAPHAWLATGWQASVLLTVGDDGCWSRIEAGAAPTVDCEVLAGPVVPGMVNAHSHAFQRAFAGLAEQRCADRDDFWLWRDRMYQVALRVSPEQQRAIARWLCIELLGGGYTHVCEFHYLHTAPHGGPYSDPLAMTWSLLDAAADAGIGMTMIPVVYERAGFREPRLRDDQRRFSQSAVEVWAAARAVRHSGRPLATSAIGIHSLRAAEPASLRTLMKLADTWTGPIHAHVAEQTGEVEDCLAATGRRPVEWLAAEGALDSRWHLTHATHAMPAELDQLAATGAGVILCPTTEANLGDGFCDLPGLLGRGIRCSLGSDSQVGRSWAAELRLLETSQRLLRRQRCIAAVPHHQASTGERLATLAWSSGSQAAALTAWGVTPGARADALVADTALLAGIPKSHWLDALIFTDAARPWRDVFVAGRCVIRNHEHSRAESARREFHAAMTAIWSDAD